MSVLEVDRLVARHGLLAAVREVSLSVGEGEVLALVGANGAGKTTLLRTIAGAHPVASGQIRFEGEDIGRLPAHKRVGRGLALVPEGRKLFGEMTVEENLLVAGARAGTAGPGFWGRRARPTPGSARSGHWTVDRVLEAFPLLQPLRHKRASALSGGEQQATSIGRALMTNPRLLLIDEVSLGLAPVAVDMVYRSLSSLIAEGATIVLVEQDLQRALSVANRVVCMLEGRVALSAETASVTRDQVTDAYFGLSRIGSNSKGSRKSTVEESR